MLAFLLKNISFWVSGWLQTRSYQVPPCLLSLCMHLCKLTLSTADHQLYIQMYVIHATVWQQEIREEKDCLDQSSDFSDSLKQQVELCNKLSRYSLFWFFFSFFLLLLCLFLCFVCFAFVCVCFRQLSTSSTYLRSYTSSIKDHGGTLRRFNVRWISFQFLHK